MVLDLLVVGSILTGTNVTMKRIGADLALLIDFTVVRVVIDAHKDQQKVLLIRILCRFCSRFFVFFLLRRVAIRKRELVEWDVDSVVDEEEVKLSIQSTFNVKSVNFLAMADDLKINAGST